MKIIKSRDANQMAFSNWTEYLVLTHGETKKYKLFTGQFEVLGEREDYYDEDTDDYELPEEIDGKAVEGIEEEYVIGGDLTHFDASQAVEFDDMTDAALTSWMDESEWSKHVSIEHVQKFVENTP